MTLDRPHHDPIRRRQASVPKAEVAPAPLPNRVPLVGVGRGKTLQEIAINMRILLQDRSNGWVQSHLSRGLNIVLQRNEQQWRLALGREGMPPSDSEVEVCAKAFRVPDGTEPVRSQKRTQNGKTDRRLVYQVVELFWREGE